MHSLTPSPNSKPITHSCAFTFLITKSGKVVGHLRDDIPNIDHPGRVGAFGGAVEEGEDALTAAHRELGEEISLDVGRDGLVFFLNRISWRVMTKEWELQNFYYTIIDDKDLEGMEVYEGQGWTYINDPSDERMIQTWGPLLEHLFDILKLQGILND